jgi:carbonic anhydrase
MTRVHSTRTDTPLADARRYRADFQPGASRNRVAVVTCMDARINVYALFGLGEGDADVVGNAGGVVTHDVIRSLTISPGDVTDEQFAAAVQADVEVRPTLLAAGSGRGRPGVARLRGPFLHTHHRHPRILLRQNDRWPYEIC